MRRFISLFWGFFFLLSVTVAHSAEHPDEAGIDFLYVNANAGEAAGGHTALRLGDSIFHYQFFPDSSFLLVREPWESFRFLYTDLHNRSISIASLPLELSVAAQIRNHFTELLVAQQKFIEDFEALQQEKQFIEQLLNGHLNVSVRCLGFFTKTSGSVNMNDPLYSLSEDGSLQKLLQGAEQLLQASVQKILNGERLGKEFQERLAWREALLVLRNRYSLKSEALIYPMDEEHQLTPHEKQVFEAFSKGLFRSLTELLYSTRLDRGEALLLQIARYRTAQKSIAEGVLLTLDPFFKGVRVVELTDEDVGGGRLSSLQNDLLQRAKIRRKLFFKEKLHSEIAYSLMETGRARAWELAKVTGRQRSVRSLAKVTLPSRPETLSFELPKIHTKNLQNLNAVVAQELVDKKKQREERYGYNLVWRNCATELIRSLNTTFPDQQTGRDALGGWLEPNEGLVFIPFLFYEKAIAAFSLQKKQFLQARRLRHLETLYAQESNFLVWLQESNTLSATLYEPRSKDTPFLFFTDDSLLLRPILGAFNIGYAALYGIAGITRFPFDHGESLNQAARGIFYSLPELAFGNIRKGSYSTGDTQMKILPQTHIGEQ